VFFFFSRLHLNGTFLLLSLTILKVHEHYPFHSIIFRCNNKNLIARLICGDMIVAIKGGHNTGKTAFIEEVVRRFSDLSVVVIKLSGQDSIDMEGKDTHRYRMAGAQASIIVTKNETVLFSKKRNIDSVLSLARKLMPDIIIVEGYERINEIPHTLIVDMEKDIDMEKTCEQMAEMMENKENDIAVFADGHAIPLNTFTRELFHKTIRAMLSCLKGGDGGHVEIFIRGEGRKHI